MFRLRSSSPVRQSAAGRFKSSVLRSISGGSYCAPTVIEAEHPTETTVYCSILYSGDFILKELNDVRENEDITTLTIENALQRGAERVLEECVRLVADTAMVSSNKTDIVEELRREWQCITFIDTLHSASEYHSYLVASKKFQSDLRKTLKTMGITKLKIKFAARLEFSAALLDREDTARFLKIVAKEGHRPINTISYVTSKDRGVEFEEGGDMKKFPKVLSSHFSSKTLEWKNDDAVIRILIQYGSGGPKDQVMKQVRESTTKVLKHSAKRLEKLISQEQQQPQDN